MTTPEKDKWIAEKVSTFGFGCCPDCEAALPHALRATLSDAWDAGITHMLDKPTEKRYLKAHEQLVLASYKAELAGQIKEMKREHCGGELTCAQGQCLTRAARNRTLDTILALLQTPEETK